MNVNLETFALLPATVGGTLIAACQTDVTLTGDSTPWLLEEHIQFYYEH